MLQVYMYTTKLSESHVDVIFALQVKRFNS